MLFSARRTKSLLPVHMPRRKTFPATRSAASSAVAGEVAVAEAASDGAVSLVARSRVAGTRRRRTAGKLNHGPPRMVRFLLRPQQTILPS